MNETWKKVGNCHYSVSSLGRVRNDSTNKIKALRVDKHGYVRVDIYENGKPIRERMHRLVANTFIPNPDNKPQVNHKNGNKMDNAVSNLEWATAKENMEHASKYDLVSHAPSYGMRGKKNPNGGAKGKRIRVVETQKEYKSIIDCAKDINGRDRGICDVLSGKQKSHRGYTFERIT